LKITNNGTLNQSTKTVTHKRIEAIAATKPLPWPALLKPEVQNVVSGQDEQL
jgi:hypothetical protein